MDLPDNATVAAPRKAEVPRARSVVLRVRSVALLVLLDLLVIVTSFATAAALRGGQMFDRAGLLVMATLLFVYLVTAFNTQAYSAGVLQEPFGAIRRGVRAFLVALAVSVVLIFYTRSGGRLSRVELAGGSGGAVLLLTAMRFLYVRHLPGIVGGNPFSAILIRDGNASVPTADFSEVVSAETYFDPDEHDPFMYDRLAKSLAFADRVVIACPAHRRAAWARALRGANIQGEILVPELGDLAPLGMGPRGSGNGPPSVIVATGPLSLFDRGVKRAFDVMVAGTVLLCIAPLMMLVALWVRLDSPGPVLFRQTRIGRGNQMFKVMKFRSMKVARADGAGHRSASRDDDRITRCGRFIRRTSIDELPQLLNVLRGDMSIVGPRPHALGSRAADKLFWEVDDRYWDRHAAKPGLTGLAQVRGFRGATVVEDDLRNRLQADLEYLQSWSIWRDLKIIFLTARVVLHRNAY